MFPFLFDKNKNINLYKSNHILNIKDKKILKENSDIIIEKRKTIKNKILKEDIINMNK